MLRVNIHQLRGDDDKRRREVDRLLESLDAASAQPALLPRIERRETPSAFVEGFSLHGFRGAGALGFTTGGWRRDWATGDDGWDSGPRGSS